MNDKIILFDKTFKPFIPYQKIERAIDSVAARINRDYGDSEDVPILLCVLNGSVMFTAELMKRLKFRCELVSMKLTSYQGTQSSGKVRQVMGLTSSVKDRRVIVIEDIVDTGATVVDLVDILRGEGASDIKICTLLLKPQVYDKPLKLDYVGLEIPNDFIVGFGLDYDQLGRNLRDIYVLDTDADGTPDTLMDLKNAGKMKYYVLFGPPGAGKGTQASSIAAKFNLCHISTGDLLRKEIAAGTELGLKAKALIDAGELVPDEVVEGMIWNKFNTEKGVNGFLLDGFPRTIAQAEALDAMLDKRKESVTALLALMIPDEMIFERIKGRAAVEGRADDASDETISNRIRTYHEKTEPLVNYYKGARKYNEINGTGTIEEVRDRIFSVMENL